MHNIVRGLAWVQRQRGPSQTRLGSCYRVYLQHIAVTISQVPKTTDKKTQIQITNYLNVEEIKNQKSPPPTLNRNETTIQTPLALTRTAKKTGYVNGRTVRSTGSARSI